MLLCIVCIVSLVLLSQAFAVIAYLFCGLLIGKSFRADWIMSTWIMLCQWMKSEIKHCLSIILHQSCTEHWPSPVKPTEKNDVSTFILQSFTTRHLCYVWIAYVLSLLSLDSITITESVGSPARFLQDTWVGSLMQSEKHVWYTGYLKLSREEIITVMSFNKKIKIYWESPWGHIICHFKIKMPKPTTVK